MIIAVTVDYIVGYVANRTPPMYPHVHTRDVTIWVDAILRIAFECIAIYCHIAICG